MNSQKFKGVFQSIGKQKEINSFQYEEITKMQELKQRRFYIKTIHEHPRGEVFQFKIKYIKENIYKIVMMTHNNDPEYQGKGIPEYFIPIIMKELKIKIVSSTNIDIPGEHRTNESDKFWKRMCSLGKAKYDEENKYFEFLHEETPGNPHPSISF